MINSKYKDRLFSFIFGRAERKDWTLSLYNAVNHSSYTNPDDITVITMEDVLYMGMKNDLSFFVTNIINMYEQQSSYNPNMPIRKLMYASRLYDRYIHINKLNIYGTKLIPLPVPKLVTFYNGKEEKEDEILELKNAFRDKEGNLVDAESDIEVRVRMININYGKNKELMLACKPLFEYAWFIDTIRKNGKTMGIEDAVDKALDSMPDDFVIKMLLIANKAEVKQMCLTEYNETETMEMFREEGREQGRKEGREQGRKEGREQGQKEGREQGRKEGREEGLQLGELKKLICIVYKKMLKGKTSEEMADEMEEDISNIEQVKTAILEYKKIHENEEFDASKVLEYFN